VAAPSHDSTIACDHRRGRYRFAARYIVNAAEVSAGAPANKARRRFQRRRRRSRDQQPAEVECLLRTAAAQERRGIPGLHGEFCSLPATSLVTIIRGESGRGRFSVNSSQNAVVRAEFFFRRLSVFWAQP